MPLPTAAPASSGLPSPIFWPSSTVMPMARPVMTIVTVCMIWLPVDTAEMSAAVPNFPTTCRSTAPYMACSSRASRTGSANFSRADRIGPCVNDFCVSIVSSHTMEGMDLHARSLLRVTVSTPHLRRKKLDKRPGAPGILSSFVTAATSPPMNRTYSNTARRPLSSPRSASAPQRFNHPFTEFGW